MSEQYRVEIRVDWLDGLRDRIGRPTIETLKGWLLLALLTVIVALLAMQAMRGTAPAPSPAPDAGPPAVKPDVKPEVKPGELGPPAAVTPETPLSKALRDYHRRFPAVVPKTLWELADKLDNREFKDKATAITFYKRDAVALSQALDGVFSPGIDPDSKDPKSPITNPAAISGPLRQTARALGYKPPASAGADAGTQSFAPEAP